MRGVAEALKSEAVSLKAGSVLFIAGRQEIFVAQASSWWQQLLNWIESGLLVRVKGRAVKRLYPHRFQGAGSWLLGLTGIIAMLFWNWKLLLATSAGVFVMLLVYLMQEWNWQFYWSSLRRYLTGSNRQLTLAVGSGGIATLSTYMAVSIWVESDSAWIAGGAILQGFGTLATLIFLVFFNFSRQASWDESIYDQMLRDLTDTEPLKRLLAVQQLTRWGVNNRLPSSRRRIVVDCFRLMLSREQEAVIRDAILEGFQVLDNNQVLGKSAQPFQTPIALKHSAAKVHRQSDI